LKVRLVALDLNPRTERQSLRQISVIGPNQENILTQKSVIFLLLITGIALVTC
jgi:hypothetical protein